MKIENSNDTWCLEKWWEWWEWWEWLWWQKVARDTLVGLLEDKWHQVRQRLLFETTINKHNIFDAIAWEIWYNQNQALIFCIGFIEWSGWYKKLMEMIHHYSTLWHSNIYVLLTSSIYKNKPKIRTFLEQDPHVTVELVDDTLRSTQKCVEEKYIDVHKKMTSIVEKLGNNDWWVVSIWRQTFFPEAARRNNLPYVMMHWSLPDQGYDAIGKSGYPATEYNSWSYSNRTFLVTRFPWDENKATLDAQGKWMTMNVKYVSQPFGKNFLEQLEGIYTMSPQCAQEILLQRRIFKNLDENDIIIRPSRSGSLFDPSLVWDPNTWFTKETYGQSVKSLVWLYNQIIKLANEEKKVYALHLSSEAKKTLIKLSKWKNSQYVKLLEEERKLDDTELLYLRKAGIEIIRAPQAVSTMLSFAIGANPLVHVVPFGDKKQWIPDYMWETKAAHELQEEWLIDMINHYTQENTWALIQKVMKEKWLS